MYAFLLLLSIESWQEIQFVHVKYDTQVSTTVIFYRDNRAITSIKWNAAYYAQQSILYQNGEFCINFVDLYCHRERTDWDGKFRTTSHERVFRVNRTPKLTHAYIDVSKDLTNSGFVLEWPKMFGGFTPLSRSMYGQARPLDLDHLMTIGCN